MCALALAAWASTAARAQCPEPTLGPQDVLPAVGAPGVTTDAWLRARYSPGYFGPDGPGEDPASLVTLLRCGACGSSCEDGEPVSGSVEVFGDDLFFSPSAPLEARTQYGGVVRGVEATLSISFCTGTSVDTAAPVFGRDIRVSSEEVGPGCDLPEGGFRVGVFADAAMDDGPGGSLEYLLFLTRADGLSAPVLVDRVRHFSTEEITMRLFLDGAQAASPVCVRLGVVDGVGNVTMSEVEECFDPIAQIAFQGCAVDAPGRSGRAPLTTLVVALGLACSIAARRRRAR